MPLILSEISGSMFESKQKLNNATTYEMKAKTSFAAIKIISSKFFFDKNESNFFKELVLPLINRIYNFKNKNSQLQELDRTEIIFIKISQGLKLNGSFNTGNLFKLLK